MHLCLHDSVDGRVGEDGLVVEQVALGVEAHHLTTGAESGVDAHHAFLSERCIHKQLAKILGEHLYGFLVGLFLAHGGKLGLDAGLQQTIVAVFYGLGHQPLAFAMTFHIVT